MNTQPTTQRPAFDSARKELIRKRSLEIYREAKQSEFEAMRKKREALDYIASMPLPGSIAMEKKLADLNDLLLRKAEWIIREKAKGKNMEAQEKELALLFSLPEAIRTMSEEFTGVVQLLQSAWKEQAAYLSAQIESVSEANRHLNEISIFCSETAEKLLQCN